MSTQRSAPHQAADKIQADGYLRERISPRPGDLVYLHLSDLLRALRQFAPEAASRILDYGCGGSPYRSLFQCDDYRRADFLQAEGDKLNYVLDGTSRVAEKDAEFDLILSTQVAEHLRYPAIYFAECQRLLKPGGLLVISTHGTFHDHGCPEDYQRWTADGLRRDLEAAGLRVNRMLKITTSARAVLSILDFGLGYLIHRWSSLAPLSARGITLRPICLLANAARIFAHKVADRAFPNCRVIEQDLEAHPFYLGLLAVAERAVEAG